MSTAVPAYRGICLTVVENGHPVTVATVRTPHAAESFATSLRLPLAALGPGFHVDSQLVFYAATPGAFVDLAADLGYASTIRPRPTHVRPGLPPAEKSTGVKVLIIELGVD